MGSPSEVRSTLVGVTGTTAGSGVLKSGFGVATVMGEGDGETVGIVIGIVGSVTNAEGEALENGLIDVGEVATGCGLYRFAKTVNRKVSPITNTARETRIVIIIHRVCICSERDGGNIFRSVTSSGGGVAFRFPNPPARNDAIWYSSYPSRA